MKLIFSLIIVLFLYSSSGVAEYRVFELNIVDESAGKTRMVKTTLDHLQYKYYHHVKPTEYVQYKTSWKCFGNHSHFTRFCKNPRNAPVLGPEPAIRAPAQGL